MYNLEWSQSKLIFNLFLIFKMNIILKFAIFILQRAQPELLAMGFEDALGRINSMSTIQVREFIEWCSQRDGGSAEWGEDAGSSDSNGVSGSE